VIFALRSKASFDGEYVEAEVINAAVLEAAALVSAGR
jgi:hypothetical protein